MKKAPLLLILLTVACRARAPKPVDIDASDVCAFCKMAISEKRYAAEVIVNDETLFKFDDIGCMLRFIQRQSLQPRIAAYFVVDYETRQWLRAEQASFVKSEAIRSPMSGGLMALRDKPAAEIYARQYQAPVLSFADLWKK